MSWRSEAQITPAKSATELATIADHIHDLKRALRRDNSKLGHMSADDIDDLGALAHEESAGPV